MKYDSLSYSLKVWLTSVLLAPLIFITTDYCLHPKPMDSDSIIQVYFIITLVTGIFSFVTWFIFWGAATFACHYIFDSIKRKLIMCFTGIILTICTFLLILLPDSTFSFSSVPLDILLSNCLCIGAGSLFYNLGPDGEIS
jgi:hypothetical protein